jgi:flavin-dependent dehydrogenase
VRSAAADVIVAGAGPAGAVAALQLARSGLSVLLLDRSTFPRDKTCGDGLIADSIGALNTLGLAEEVAGRSHRTSRLLVVAPAGTEVRFETTFWVLPRLVLDAQAQMMMERVGYRPGPWIEEVTKHLSPEIFG